MPQASNGTSVETEALLSSNRISRNSSQPKLYQSVSTTSSESDGDHDVGASVASIRSHYTTAISWPRAIVLFIALGVAVFLQAANLSLLTTTQGVVAEALDAYEETTSPIVGKLSYIIPARYCIFGATIIFSFGSLITSLAADLAVFLLGRVVAGIGAAGVYNIGIVLVINLSEPKKRGLYIGILNSGYTFGVALGAIIAGAVQPLMGWRALFWSQAPIFLTAGVLLFLSIPNAFDSDKDNADDGGEDDHKSLASRLIAIDYLGAFLLIASIVSALYGLAASQVQLIPILISALLFPLFLFQEVYRHPDPIIPVAVLLSRGALCSCFSTLLFMMARWAVLFFIPVFGIAVKGWGPAKAGSLLLPTNIGFATGSMLTGFFHIRHAGSYYTPCVMVSVCFGISLFILAQAAQASTATWAIVVCVFANGVCAGALLNYGLHHALHLVLPNMRFIVTALLTTFRGFSGTFGSAIGGGIFLRVLRTQLEAGFEDHGHQGDERLIRKLVGNPRLVQTLQGVERQIGITAYTKAIKTLFMAGVGLAILALILQASAGWKAPTPQGESQHGRRTLDDRQEDCDVHD